MSIADTLAEARRRAGLTITQVSQQTRIRETIIRGIEQGDFSACGGDFYARGHIRSIAKVVGLDPDQLIREYDVTHGSPHAIRAAEVFEPSTPIQIKERRSLNWSAVMVLALAAIVGFVVYHAVSSGSHSRARAAASSQHAVTTPRKHHASPPPVAATYTRRLVIKLVVESQPCWVGFTSSDGVPLTQATIPAYTTKTWTFKHAVSMQIGNPGAVVLTVNGQNRLSPGTQITPVTLSFSPVKQLSS